MEIDFVVGNKRCRNMVDKNTETDLKANMSSDHLAIIFEYCQKLKRKQESTRDELYEKPRETTDAYKKKRMLTVGDFNAKLVERRTNEEEVMGKKIFGIMGLREKSSFHKWRKKTERAC